ncbi:MAG: hypothetical protein IJV31_08175 [Clostridia bacterium]|nr:hypothetical protein [Clostridia bacterium]
MTILETIELIVSLLSLTVATLTLIFNKHLKEELKEYKEQLQQKHINIWNLFNYIRTARNEIFKKELEAETKQEVDNYEQQKNLLRNIEDFMKDNELV